jgi:indolepyruvate ferredoxin oxidoreductase alpha subunit
MTGHQPNPATGLNAMGDKAFVPSIEEICKAFGLEFVECIDSYDLKNTIDTLKQALNHKGGPSVVISRRVCALQRSRDLRRQRSKSPVYKVNEKCTGCKQCIYLGCPAIGFNLEKTNATGRKGAAFIDPLICVGCNLCAQFEVCRFSAHDKIGGGEF